MTATNHVTPAIKRWICKPAFGHKALLFFILYSALSACATSPPVDASKLDRVVGTDLPGAQGKTLKDQDRIDSALAGLCGAGIYGKDLCDVHTRASAERIGELRQ